tara:strand:- start:711 stop:1724 length:1014 start_codon:yes stop_codon:yes gene_type:complete
MVPSVFITGIGHELPKEKINNDFFEELNIGSSSSWILDRTGIAHRYSVLSKQNIIDLRHDRTSYLKLRSDNLIPSIASLSSTPWKKALSVAYPSCQDDFQPDVLISGTSVPDYDIPANASSIARELNFSSLCFDVNSACSSFLSGLLVADSLLKSGNYQNASIFNVERYSTRMNYKHKNNCVLFGDGATACLLETGSRQGLKIKDIVVKSDASGLDAVLIPYGSYFSQEGAKVQKFAVTKTCEMTKHIMERNKLKAADIRYFVGHQANYRMLQSVVDKLGFDEEQHLYNVHKYGNQGAAGAVSVLAENFGVFQKGDLVLLTVVGAGLTWGGVLFEKV